jgi:cyanophycinase-like exopeptidase
MTKKAFFIIAVLSLINVQTLIAQTFTSYFTGDTSDVQVAPQWGICLMGGATENDSAMVWFLKKANGGDVLVLRASGSDGYNNYLYNDLGVNVNSVQTLVVPSLQAANNSYVKNQILNAEAIFIAGGNQADYHNFWKNTALDTALNYFVQVKKGVIGGTSAGMAILGEYYFSALNGTVNSATALGNPFHSNITIGTSDFIKHPFLKNVITDTHYDNPDRRGRHTVFLARLQNMGKDTVYGIACDEYTAVCIDSTKIAKVYGDFPTYDDNAFFIQINCKQPNMPETILSNQSLTWNRDSAAVVVCKIKGTPTGNNTFSLNDWKTTNGGQWLYWYVNNGLLYERNGLQPVCNTLSIAQINEYEQINIYPNPVKNILHIQHNFQENTNVYVYDYMGKIVFCTNNKTIDITALQSGIYFVQIENQTLKFIKN